MKTCECGCGAPAPIAKVSMKYRGYNKGQPQRFVAGHNSTSGPLNKRFWLHVDKNGPIIRKELGPCWVWTGAHARYGTTWVNGKPELAHRTAWFLATGKWPEPCACHKCDNPLCVRFSHLFEGSQQNNVDDREAKGRNRPPKGEEHSMAKLTKEKVRQILTMLKEGFSQRHIGRIFGVSHKTVGGIGKGQSWKEVTR